MKGAHPTFPEAATNDFVNQPFSGRFREGY
jgi:hypothetical protein